MLADWNTQSKDYDLALEAADQMAKLAPLNPVPLGYAGDIALKKDDHELAIDRFSRAFALDFDRWLELPVKLPEISIPELV